MRYLLIGNYGVGNVGDEALKEYFLERFPEVEWIVVSAKPVLGLSSHSTVEVTRLPFGFRSLCTPWWRTLFAYWRCDGVVFGGGSLFTDVESTFAPFLWFLHAAVAALFRRPIFLAFQGIGPFRTRRGEWCARWVGRRAIFFSVRDTLSFERVERWSLHKKCMLSFDPVFSLVVHENNCIRSKFLFIIPRENSSKKFWDRAEVMRGEGWESVHVQEPVSFLELCRAVCSASYVLTQRYHAGIVALALGVPFETVPQVLGDKLDALNLEDRDLSYLRERVRVGEEELREALASSPRGRGSR